MFGITKTAAPRHRKVGRALLSSAAALLALATFAAPASSQPFQQYLNGTCAGTTCRMNFIKVPAGLRLDVRNVSCYLRMAVGQSDDFMPMVGASLAVLGADPTKIVNLVTLVTNITGIHNDQVVFSSNDLVSAFANAQQHFQTVLTIYGGQVFETRCHVSGDLAKAT